MNSQALPQFWRLYRALPKEIRLRVAKSYRIWRDEPHSPGLRFKRVGNRRPVYSVRVTDDYRVLGLLEADTIHWFWVGPHDEYERIIRSL
jgi:hypothetical protein